MKKSAVSVSVLAALVVAGACSREQKEAAPADSAVAASSPDADVRPAAPTGAPAGYVGRTDRASDSIANARYATSGNGWEITTGPAHILYSSKDIAGGNYTAEATIEQLEKPRHPEAFGIFIGGRDLDGPGRSYTYFLVRETGEMFGKRRAGDDLHGLVDWQKSPGVPAADASGRATYKLAAKVDGDSVAFWVNDRPVFVLPRRNASRPSANIDTDGIVGLRINHNLKLRATPIRITRQ